MRSVMSRSDNVTSASAWSSVELAKPSPGELLNPTRDLGGWKKFSPPDIVIQAPVVVVGTGRASGQGASARIGSAPSPDRGKPELLSVGGGVEGKVPGSS